MAADSHDVRRVDVGDGIYVRVARDADRAAAGPRPKISAATLVAGAALGGVALARLGPGPHGLLAAALLPVLVALAVADLRARVIPNRILGPALLGVLVWQVAFFPERSLEWLLAGLAAGAFFFVPALVYPGAVGLGDVKLAVLLGVALGADVPTALMVGSLTAAPVALFLLVRGGAAARRAALPFGPFLALGAAVVLLA
jgi:leader peptidase (prepilin peptidase)/N-methyltransferase